jgi:MerR family mercuric resistance operon transcriptional regulator
MQDLTIGKAARKAGVGIETIRFYERRGLIEQPPKPATSGFRSYPEETVERIRFIRQAQELGFSLREVCELLDLRADPRADAADVRARAAAKLTNVNDKMRQLRRIKDALETLIAACPGHGTLGCCSIMEALEGHAASDNGGTRAVKGKRKRA